MRATVLPHVRIHCLASSSLFPSSLFLSSSLLSSPPLSSLLLPSQRRRRSQVCTLLQAMSIFSFIFFLFFFPLLIFDCFPGLLPTGDACTSQRRHCEAQPWRGHYVATVHDTDVSATSCTPTAPQALTRLPRHRPCNYAMPHERRLVSPTGSDTSLPRPTPACAPPALRAPALHTGKSCSPTINPTTLTPHYMPNTPTCCTTQVRVREGGLRHAKGGQGEMEGGRGCERENAGGGGWA